MKISYDKCWQRLKNILTQDEKNDKENAFSCVKDDNLYGAAVSFEDCARDRSMLLLMEAIEKGIYGDD